MTTYFSWIAQARFARERGEYAIARYLLGQARVCRIRGHV